MKTRIIFLTISLLASTLLGIANHHVYSVNPDKSVVLWHGTKPGGEHNGAVTISQGSIELGENTIKSGSFTIDLSTIVNYDLESETWNKKLVDHLKSEDFFYIEKYPVARFDITKASTTDGKKYKIEGILTIKEVSKSISFSAKLSVTDGQLTAESDDIVIDRTQWKVEAMSKTVFSDLKDNYVDDEMTLKVKLSATSK